MKNRFEKTIILAFILIMLAMGVADADLLAHWKLDDSIGNIAIDSAGNHDGIIHGNPMWVKGVMGGALQFNNPEDYVDLGNDPVFNPIGSFSIALWVNIKNWATNWGHYMVSKRGDNAVGWSLRMNGSWAGLQPFDGLCFTTRGVSHIGTIDLEDTPSKTVPPLKQWIHIVCVYNNAKNMKYIYLNGVLNAEQATNPGTINASSHHMYLGHRVNYNNTGPDGLDASYSGMIDDVRIYDHALNEEEVVQLYKLYSVSFDSEPKLLMLSDAIEKAEVLLKEQKLQQAIALLEDKIAEYERWPKEDPNSDPLSHEELACDLYFLLAQSKEATNASKEDIAYAYKQAVRSNKLSSPKEGTALLWLSENIKENEYYDTVTPLIQSNSNYLKNIIAKVKLMIQEQKYERSIRFLENSIAACVRWCKKNPSGKVITIDILPELYYHLAKVREEISAPKKDIADAYSNTFRPSRLDYVQERIEALIWLVENERADECTKAVQLFTENSETREHIKSAISNVCGYYETSKDWEKFQYFLDTLYKEKKYLFVWAPFVESCLSDKTNRWAKQYYTYTNSEPEFKLGIDCAIADTYMADEKYDDAAELYRDIIKRCGLGDDKEAYEFELCKCLFYGGKYSESIAMLDGFISNNKELHRKLVKEAMIVKGRAHIQLAEIDKAIYVFSAMMIEYPETKQTPEPNFFIGYCFMLQGEFEKATKSFDLVAKNYPESSYKNKARLCLSRIKNMTN